MVGFEPEDSAGNHPQGAVALGALVVAGGEGAELLAAADEALDPVALTVKGAVEGTGAVFGAQFGDRVADAAAATVGPMGPPGVPFVAHDPSRSQARPARSEEHT